MAGVAEELELDEEEEQKLGLLGGLVHISFDAFVGASPVMVAKGERFTAVKQVTDPVDRDLHRGFFFHNTEGEQREAWFHVYGCRRWSYLTRNTAEDRVVGRAT